MEHKEQHLQESCTLWNATLTQSVFVSMGMCMCTHAPTHTHRVLCRRWWIEAGEAVVIEFHFSDSAVSWRAKLERVRSLLCQPWCWSLWFSDDLILTLLCTTLCVCVCECVCVCVCVCSCDVVGSPSAQPGQREGRGGGAVAEEEALSVGTERAGFPVHLWSDLSVWLSACFGSAAYSGLRLELYT